MFKADTVKQKINSMNKSTSADDFSAATGLVNILLLAWKNYGLYPEGHAVVSKSLTNLNSAFDDFFSNHSALRVTVEKTRLLSNDTVLHEVSSDDSAEDLISLLYRDGIQWLKFLPGLTMNELVYFFSVLNRYRILVEETEGDIVTGLSDGNLEHIHFKAVDIFWKDLAPLDFSTLNAELPESQEPGKHVEPDEAEGPHVHSRSEIKAKSIADPSISVTLWEITPAEHVELQKMVQEEENWDNTEDVFDALLVILRSQADKDNFSSVLDFTLEEVVETIHQNEFSLLLKLCQSLHQLLYRNAAAEFNWVRPMIERFFQDVSQPEIFDHIISKLKTLNDSDNEQIVILREVLLYFSPSIILSLGPLVLSTEVPAVRKMILEVMEYLCLKDMSPMELLLDHPDQKLGEKLLPLLNRLKGERSERIFIKMSEHSSEKVRRAAVKALVSRDAQFALRLFPLIEDPSQAIRRELLAGIAQQKSSVLENMLLNYIKENTDSKDTEYLLACYETLGRCGSDKSIPYLRRVLLDQGWNRFIGLGKPVHREGAATALAQIGNQQAQNILVEASESRYNTIKKAYERAMARRETDGDRING